MKLQDRHIDEFITLYAKHYGVVLERDTALEKGMELCRFIRIVSMSGEDKNINEYENVKNST
ncbi:MAG: hypothetical protein ACI9H6_000118 [Patiriisocius sp.]|jgi:hypothetical protein